MSEYYDLTPYIIFHNLLDKGIYICSITTIYRILRKAGLMKQREKIIRGKHESIEISATGINQLWSWDITYLKTNISGKFFYLYLFLDIWSRAIVGWEVFEAESGEKAKQLFLNLAKNNNVENLTLHSDNGSPMISSTFRATLEKLGVRESFSRPRVSNDNAYSESLFKTLKSNILYPERFNTIEDAKKWVASFVDWYNNKHLHSRIGYVTPMQRHNRR